MKERSQAKKNNKIWMQSFKQPSFQFISPPRRQFGADDPIQINVVFDLMRSKSVLQNKVKMCNCSDNITEKKKLKAMIF